MAAPFPTRAELRASQLEQLRSLVSELFPANAFYTRMFVYFSPEIPAAPTGDFHTGFIIGSGNNDLGNVQAGVGMIGSAKQFLGYSIFYANPKYEFGPWSATKITANQWLCVELFENGSDPTTEVRQIWVNDTELTDLKSSSATSAAGKQPNHLPPKFNLVSLGLWEYHPIPTLSDMWIDDVYLASDYTSFEINSMRNGSVDLQGPISSDLRIQQSVNSNTAFTVQNQYANSILTVDTTDTGNLVLNGSFVTSKPAPNDIDFIVVVARDHNLTGDLRPGAYNVVSKKRVQKRFGFDIVAVREETMEYREAVAFFQQVRGRRGLRKGILGLLL